MRNVKLKASNKKNTASSGVLQQGYSLIVQGLISPDGWPINRIRQRLQPQL